MSNQLQLLLLDEQSTIFDRDSIFCATSKKEAFPLLKDRHIKKITVKLSDDESKFYNTSYSNPVVFRHIGASSLTALMRCYEMHEKTKDNADNSNYLQKAYDEHDEHDSDEWHLKIEEKYSFPQKDSKLEYLINLLKGEDNIFKKHNKIVIFAHYIETCNYITAKLLEENQDFEVYSITGSMTKQMQNKNKKIFLDSKKAILVCSDVCKEGVNLQCASVLINYDLPFNPAILEQRIGRIDRIGQTNEIDIYNFIVDGTYDNRLYFEILMDKLNLIQLHSQDGNLVPLNVTNQEEDSKTEWDNTINSALESIKDNANELKNLLDAIETNIKKLNHDYKPDENISLDVELLKTKADELWTLLQNNQNHSTSNDINCENAFDAFDVKTKVFWEKCGAEKLEDFFPHQLADTLNVNNKNNQIFLEKMKEYYNNGLKRALIAHLLPKDVVYSMYTSQKIPTWCDTMIPNEVSYDFRYLNPDINLGTANDPHDFDKYVKNFIPLEIIEKIRQN